MFKAHGYFLSFNFLSYKILTSSFVLNAFVFVVYDTFDSCTSTKILSVHTFFIYFDKSQLK